MALYRRRLPHVYSTTSPVFLTWRLHGSLPHNRPFDGGILPSSGSFAALDRLLDEAKTGPRYLHLPAIASVVAEAIHYSSDVLRHYILHAFAIMPNHVHVLLTPRVPLPILTKALKGITARRANEILARTGTPFWQEESFDRVVRNADEFEKIRHYIEYNPVRAGLASAPEEYPWSSAWRAGPQTRGGRPRPPEH